MSKHEELKVIINKETLYPVDFIKIYEIIKDSIPHKDSYLLEFIRYGNREGHSYIGGVFETYSEALKYGIEHVKDRAGKYDLEIHAINPKFNTVELYRRYSQGDEEC